METALEFEADCIVVETNYGGAMAKATIEQAAREMDVAVRVKVVTATRAKHVRFEPVATVIEQGRLHFPDPGLEGLEDECCAFTAEGYEGEGSPDRADALVWAAAEVMQLFVNQGIGWDDLYEGASA